MKLYHGPENESRLLILSLSVKNLYAREESIAESCIFRKIRLPNVISIEFSDKLDQ